VRSIVGGSIASISDLRHGRSTHRNVSQPLRYGCGINIAVESPVAVYPKPRTADSMRIPVAHVADAEGCSTDPVIAGTMRSRTIATAASFGWVAASSIEGPATSTWRCNEPEETEVTIQLLGLALFILSVMVLGCFSLSRYAPNAPPSEVGDRILAKSSLYHRWAAAARLRIQLVLTFAMGGAATWIIVVEHGPDDRKWAYGTLAMLLGYWLKV